MESENSRALHGNRKQSSKIVVLFAGSQKPIWRPLFFQEINTEENYPTLLNQFIALLGQNGRGCWCQQDGANPHAANKRTAFLPFFGGRIVGRGLWPPSSSDLTSLDFFLMGIS